MAVGIGAVTKVLIAPDKENIGNLSNFFYRCSSFESFNNNWDIGQLKFKVTLDSP